MACDEIKCLKQNQNNQKPLRIITKISAQVVHPLAGFNLSSLSLTPQCYKIVNESTEEVISLFSIQFQQVTRLPLPRVPLRQSLTASILVYLILLQLSQIAQKHPFKHHMCGGLFPHNLVPFPTEEFRNSPLSTQHLYDLFAGFLSILSEAMI